MDGTRMFREQTDSVPKERDLDASFRNTGQASSADLDTRATDVLPNILPRVRAASDATLSPGGLRTHRSD